MPNYGTYALCPFFESERDKKIICKGMSCMCKDVLTALEFDSKENKKAWLKKHCETFRYEKCPYYSVLGTKMINDGRDIRSLNLKRKNQCERAQVEGQIRLECVRNEQKS